MNNKQGTRIISGRGFRLAFAVILSLAVMLSGMYVPALPDGSPAPGVEVAYAATTTGGAVTTTGGAVTGPVDISVAQVAQIKDYTYNGKSKKPSPKVTIDGKKLKKNRDYTLSYKNNKLPGKATLTIKSKSSKYKGSIKITFRILVQKPEKFKLKTTADSIQVSWKKAAGKITGYKVLYAENSKFTKTKKTKTLTSAKSTEYSIDRPYFKRSYYVKVRAYVTIKGKNYYSEYTSVKNRKTKDASWFSKVSSSIGDATKWIETDLSKQIVYLHKGRKIVKAYSVSSGKPGTPTVRGTFRIYKKIRLHDMKGDWNPETKQWGYITPNVKWSTYFTADYAFHGAYWNPEVNKPLDAKRTPRSHGCVNMRDKDAGYLYNWAPTGTLVIVHK
jgi:lipoprotein-anchoring transpeptidase ErfK/SrfK